jgi:hypothetical protein
MNNAVFWDMASCGFNIKYISEKRVASFFRVDEVTRAKKSVRRLLTLQKIAFFIVAAVKT